MFNRAGFNNLRFNQQIGEYEINKQDELEVLVEEEQQQQAELTSQDEIVVSVSEEVTDIDIGYYLVDNWDVYFVEGIDIYAETSGTDPPIDEGIYLEESAVVEISASDNLDVAFDIEVPLGFNSQKFNQPQLTTTLNMERAIVGIIQSDDLNIELEEIAEEYVEIEVSDNLNIILDRSAILDKEVFVSDSLDIELEETIQSLSTEIEVYDELNINFDDIPAQIELSSSVDDLYITIDTGTRITGTLMYLVDGKFVNIDKGYVKVNGEFKPIVQYYAKIDGQWKPRLT